MTVRSCENTYINVAATFGIPETIFSMEKKKFLKKLGAQVRRVRAQRGYSQDRVYLEGDIPRVTIHRIESGIVDARASTLERIAETIGVPVKKFFDFE